MVIFYRFIIIFVIFGVDFAFPGSTGARQLKHLASATTADPVSNQTSTNETEDYRNLMKAAKEGDLITVKDLIEGGIDVNAGKALEIAVKYGHIDIVKVLLEEGGDPDGHNDLNSSSGWLLFWAAGNNRVDIIDVLLDAGADVSAHPIKGGTILKAAENGQLEGVQRLLEAGFDPNYNEGFAFVTSVKNGHLDIVKAFIKAGLNVTSEAHQKSWALHQSVIRGFTDIIEVLVENGVDINTRFYDGSTVLHIAAAKGLHSIIQKLLFLGADINAVSKKGNTPLHLSVKNLRLMVIDELLKSCADSNIVNNEGNRALDLAKQVIATKATETIDHRKTSKMLLLEDIAKDVFQVRVNSYYPYNQKYVDLLTKELQAAVDSNSSLATIREEQTPSTTSWKDLQRAVAGVFEEKAVSGMLKVFKDNGCKLGTGLVAELGMEFTVKCECLVKQGWRLTASYFPPQRNRCDVIETGQL